MNTPSFQPDPSGHGKQTSDYRTNQLQDAAARTVRVERARLERLWNQHLDGELAADSKAEFESLCKRYPDLSRELRTTGMLLSGMNLLTADVPASPVADRERNAAILAAVQAERPFVSAGEARAIRRQRWILVGSAAALLISVVAADRFFPGWKDPAGMTVATRSTAAPAPVSAPAIASPDRAVAASIPAAPVTTATPRREALNASAQLSLGGARPELNLSTDLIPTMASQSGIASRSATRSFGLHANEAWLLKSISAEATPIEPFIASARLRLTDTALSSVWADSFTRPQATRAPIFDGNWKGLLPDAEELRPARQPQKQAR